MNGLIWVGVGVVISIVMYLEVCKFKFIEKLDDKIFCWLKEKKREGRLKNEEM